MRHLWLVRIEPVVCDASAWMQNPVGACCLFLLLLLGLGSSPARATSDLTLPGGHSVTTLNAPGNLVLHVPSGTLEVTTLDLRAGYALEFEPLTLITTTVSLCTTASWAGCVPFEDGTFGTSADPFRITVLGPLTGALEIYAAGSILVTNEPAPIPEPSTGLLVSTGLLGLAARRRTLRS